MANAFAKTVVSLVASLVAAGVASAQDLKQRIEEAEIKLRTNQQEEALAILSEVLRSDPSNEDAFELWKTARKQAFELFLAEGGDFAKITKALLDRARIGAVELSRDEEAIASLVQQALSSDVAVSREAAVKLAAEHGEFAVPALLRVLTDADAGDQTTMAIHALEVIGRPAVLPLLVGLRSPSADVRGSVAAALAHIGDNRAAAALAEVFASDSSEAVRFAAQSALKHCGVADPASADAAALYVRAATSYLGGVGAGEASSVVWSAGEDGPVAHDVPGPLYGLELAKQSAQAALRVDATSDAAKSLLARAYLAQVAAIREHSAANPDDELMAAVAPVVPQLRMVALALGTGVLRSALSDALAAGQIQVAVEAIGTLARSEERRGLGSSPLVAALDNADSRVRIAAALALTEAAGGGAVPAADKVVAALGSAVEMEALRFIKVIDGNNAMTKSVANATDRSQRGMAVDAVSSGERAVADVFSFPNYDVVVVNETLPDHRPEHVISLIRKRAPNTKILLLVSSEDGGEGLADRVDGVIAGPLTEASLVEKANEVMGDLDPKRARADEVAVAASHALSTLAANAVDVSGALASLGKQLNRADAVAIPAAHALGDGGTVGDIAALESALGDSSSLDLRVAAANALGAILARAGQAPAGLFDRLLAIAADGAQDSALRTAVANAIGRAKLDPGSTVKLAETLGTIATSGNDG